MHKPMGDILDNAWLLDLAEYNTKDLQSMHENNHYLPNSPLGYGVLVSMSARYKTIIVKEY